jgi:peptide-methionine (S)-S-oxide reductase
MKKIITLIVALLLASCNGQSKDTEISKKVAQQIDKTNLEYVTIGGGCFWCVQPCFEMLKGVESVVSGYSGGYKANPTYEDVSSGETGHAEVIRIGFDSKVISYKKLMDVFFFLHDPTQLNRQGNDVGTQYRSVVFYNDETQKKETEEAIKASEATGKWSGKYVTQVVPFEKFWSAEAYHQDYYDVNPTQPYCSAVVGPKIAKFKKYYSELGWLKPNS